MTNLWKETIDVLEQHGKTLDDVRYIIGNGHEITLDNFREIAVPFDYHEGFGGAEVPEDLYIVGDDWWMQRGEYDGSEWWDFLRKPDRPKESRHVVRLDRYETGDERYVYTEKPNENGGGK